MTLVIVGAFWGLRPFAALAAVSVGAWVQYSVLSVVILVPICAVLVSLSDIGATKRVIAFVKNKLSGKSGKSTIKN